MKLVIVHYHLNRGGVTRVIESHLQALSGLDDEKRPDSVLILHGGRADGLNLRTLELPFAVADRTIETLEYDELQQEGSSASRVAELYGHFANVLREFECETRSTVIHIHNHGLGKNASLLDVMDLLIADGWRMLLQIHDFAEELRPDNYRRLVAHYESPTRLQAKLYPQSNIIRYATLTRRDASVLEHGGISSERIDLLPNPVSALPQTADRLAAREKLRDGYGLDVDRPLVVYPVRGIRRKNVGELLLWAIMHPEIAFAITLAPKNPVEQNSFVHWQTLAEELGLRILFDIGGRGGMTLEESYASANAIITTSIAEGFGLVFLEASMMGLELFGRDLPGVTADFRQCGMRFPGLAAEISVPARLVDVERLKTQYVQHAVSMNERYGNIVDESSIKVEVDELLETEMLDFARLNRDAQEGVLRQLAEEGELREELTNRNPVFARLGEWLQSAGESVESAATHNQSVIPSAFGPQVVGRTYSTILKNVLESSPSPPSTDAAIGQKVLASFLNMTSLYPIRLEP